MVLFYLFFCFGCPVLLEYVTYIKSLRLYDLRILSLIHCMFIQFTPFILHTYASAHTEYPHPGQCNEGPSRSLS